MTHFTQLRVFKQARKNLVSISKICKQINGFGDIKNQIQRAAISVVSNIAEGAGYKSDKQMSHFLDIARGSNHEMLAQLMILQDIDAIKTDHVLIDEIEHCGRMLSKLIHYLATG